MENEQHNQLSKKEQYDLERQEKLEVQSVTAKKSVSTRLIKIILWVVVIGGGIGALVWYIANAPKIPESDIISRQGIHWHPELTITIKGEKQEIPANLGLGVGAHKPIHTHDSTGVLHLEIQGLVIKDATKLGVFFKIWGKEFNSTCIIDICNGSEGTVKMLVNGQENNEFENYLMQDKDKIEISFE